MREKTNKKVGPFKPRKLSYTEWFGRRGEAGGEVGGSKWDRQDSSVIRAEAGIWQTWAPVALGK